jgi:hypothetical protein
MGWDSKHSYPPGAVKKVTVMATEGQLWAWEAERRKHGMSSMGAFLAWAGDLYIALHCAWEDAVQAHEDALEGPGGADRRQREREGER